MCLFSICSQHQTESSEDENDTNTEKPLDIPKELWMMVDHLFRNALNQVRQLLKLLIWCYNEMNVCRFSCLQVHIH